MDLNSALDIIIKDLREAREIISDLSNYKGVPAFQVELAKAKCKSAEEIITLLKTIYPIKGEESEEVNSTAGSPDKKQVEKSVEKKPVMVEPVTVVEDAPPVGEVGKAILADRFGEVEKRINEKMHGRRSDDDISSRMKHSPINNLADAIGINDKFYFTREIFGGNSDSYRNAINRLNNASGIREAEGIIKECGSIEVNSEAVRELLALVKRKTGSDE